MSRQRYSIKESWNRILRMWQGEALQSDIPDTLSGEILSENEALSDLAELMQGSLPGQTLFVPRSASLRFGEIYAEPSTGTSQALVTGTWAQITGFETDGLSSDGVTPDQAGSEIGLDLAGTYLVDFGISFEAPNGTATSYHFEAALDGVRQEAVSAKRGLGSSGAIIGNVKASGFVTATAGQDLTIEVLTEDADRILHTHEVQLNAIKVA